MCQSDCCCQKRPFVSAPFHIWGDLPEHTTQGRPIGRRFFSYNHCVIICYCTDLDTILFIFVVIVIASSCLCVCLIHDFLMLQVFPSKNKKQETQGLFLDNCIMILKAAKYGPYLESLNNEVRLQTIFSFDWTSFLLIALHLYLYECYQCWSARSS